MEEERGGSRERRRMTSAVEGSLKRMTSLLTALVEVRRRFMGCHYYS